MHLITCKKTCCTTTTRRSSRRRPRRLVPQSPSFTPSTAHPQITVYSSSVRQKISLLRRSRRKKGGERREGSDMDQRQTNWQVIQLTRASLTMERSGGGRMAGERMASTRGTGMSCSSLPPSLRLSVRLSALRGRLGPIDYANWGKLRPRQK